MTYYLDILPGHHICFLISARQTKCFDHRNGQSSCLPDVTKLKTSVKDQWDIQPNGLKSTDNCIVSLGTNQRKIQIVRKPSNEKCFPQPISASFSVVVSLCCFSLQQLSFDLQRSSDYKNFSANGLKDVIKAMDLNRFLIHKLS
ncbi:hypothetical protein X801_01003, partial [Opisthorchis viverrini]